MVGQLPEKSRKRKGLVKAIGIGLGMFVIAWGTPLSAGTGPGDTSGWFSPRTQPTHLIAADLQNDGMNILLARGGRGVSPGSATAAVQVRAFMIAMPRREEMRRLGQAESLEGIYIGDERVHHLPEVM